MPQTLYNFICRDDNFKTLNKVKLKFNHANEIIKLFIEDESFSSQQQQFDTLKSYLIEHAKSYQFIYANLFPRCFARIDDYGVQSKTKFNVHYKNYLNQKNIFDWYQKNSLTPAEEKNNEENISADSTPLNMTKLNEKEEEEEIVVVEKKEKEVNIKKEDVAATTAAVTTVVADKIENNKPKKKKAAKEIVLKKISEEEKKENKIKKLKMSAEKKRQKRNEKKRKLEEELNKNMEKLHKIKKLNKNNKIVM